MSDLGRQWAEAQKAGDQAKMDAAHAAAEAIRAGYGYSGGGDGSEYIALPKETKVSGGGGSDVTSRRFTYESAPTYTNKYQSQIDELTRQILGREAFSYDPEQDPTYQQYKESYTRNGQRAMQDTLGQVSARTGGLASSYAGAAAQQTYDGYMSALADKIPELKQLAYQMYRDQGADQRANLEMLMALEQGDYNKYLTLLGQYNTDRGFDYGVFSDQRAFDYGVQRDQVADSQWQQTFDRGVLESDRAFDYGVQRDQVADSQWQQTFDRGVLESDRAFDYGVQRDQVADSQWQQTFDRGVLESDRAFSYQQGRDQIADQRYEQEYKDSRADVEWQRLNYANETEYNRALQKAQTLAAAGDFSGYKAMGYSDSEVANLKTAYNKAQQVVSSSKGSSGGSSSGSKQDTGILAAMYALGNDGAAYEYLVGLDLSATKTDTLWKLYQGSGQMQSKNYDTVKDTAMGYKNPDDAKAYIERMVDGGYITPDEGVDIWSVNMGQTAQATQGVPTSYKEFAARTGQSGIYTESEFSRRKGSKGYVTAHGVNCKTYQDYLNLMWEKYKK